MIAPKPYLGWAVTLCGPLHDEMGAAHLLYRIGQDTCPKTACGTRARIKNDIQPEPPNYRSGTCSRCATAARAALAKAGAK